MNDEKMMGVLSAATSGLLRLMEDRGRWSSLIINRRKPWTFRAFTNFEHEGEKFRICLHRFETCDPEESFLHPHPWPGAFRILKGFYDMNVGLSVDRYSPPSRVAKLHLGPDAVYAITNPLTWHSVTPLEECYTIMVNGKPWDPETVAHTAIRTTKGKDLDTMATESLTHHFDMFRKLLGGER